MTKLGIIILNWNDYESTINLIESLLSIEKDISKYHIYITDNGSTDNSPNEMRKYIKSKGNKGINNIDLICSNANLGYARGNNLGIRKAIEDNCQYTLILNNDIILEKPIIDEMLDYYEEKQDIGIVTLKILNQDYSLQKWCARKTTTILHRIFIYSPLSRLIKNSTMHKKYFYDVEKISIPIEIEVFSGAAFLVSTHTMQRIGLFDENTFLYEEENILAHKIKSINKKIIFLPQIYIIHQEGKSTQKLGIKKYKYMMESEKYYIEKYSNEKYLKIKKVLLFTLRNAILNFKKLVYVFKKKVI